jgi:mannitol-specific phosphotransferase system IIBC component
MHVLWNQNVHYRVYKSPQPGSILILMNQIHTLRFLKIWFSITLVALGSLVVACLSLGPKIRRFKRAEDDGFLRAMKIRNTVSFGRKVKPSATCRKISQYAKHTYEYERDASRAKYRGHFLANYFLLLY